MLVITALLSIAPPRAFASGPRAGATYVALGDSYASGEGLSPYEAGTAVASGAQRNECHRSASQAYADLSPPVVLPGIASRAFWACAGATVSDMEQVPPQSGPDEQFDQVDQVSSVGTSTEWITASIGGNDVGFSSITDACVEAVINGDSVDRFSSVTCSQQLATSTGELGALKGTLESLYGQLLTRAPAARLVVVGYPKVFPSTFLGAPTVAGQPFCLVGQLAIPAAGTTETVDVGLPTPDAQAVGAFIVQLDETIEDAIMVTSASAAYAGRIRYADTYGPSTPLDCLGTPNATVAGFELAAAGTGIGPGGIVSSGSFHPTAAGQQLIAQVVQDTVEQFPPVSITAPGLPAGIVGQQYLAALHATGGIAPYDWSVGSGALPSGLSLDPATGVISGTPVTAGGGSLEVMATDVWGDEGEQTYVIDIASAPSRATVRSERRHRRGAW